MAPFHEVFNRVACLLNLCLIKPRTVLYWTVLPLDQVLKIIFPPSTSNYLSFEDAFDLRGLDIRHLFLPTVSVFLGVPRGLS